MPRRSQIVVVAIVVLLLGGLLLVGRPASRHGVAAGPPEPQGEPAASLKWDRPRFPARARERRHMVRTQIESRGVANTAVLEAMRNVARREFVPRARVRSAYDDRPLRIGYGQTISQPYIVAYMTEVLRLKRGQKVLEIGTGSGYQAAVLSEITPHVFTIEIIRALGNQAKKRLARLGYKTVQCKIADGYHGWKDHAPFDAIIVTCAAGSVPPPLIRQLKPGGRMCIPVGPPGHVQQLVLVTKDEKGRVRSRSLMAVAFVPLTRRVR